MEKYNDIVSTRNYVLVVGLYDRFVTKNNSYATPTT